MNFPGKRGLIGRLLNFELHGVGQNAYVAGKAVHRAVQVLAMENCVAYETELLRMNRAPDVQAEAGVVEHVCYCAPEFQHAGCLDTRVRVFHGVGAQARGPQKTPSLESLSLCVIEQQQGRSGKLRNLMTDHRGTCQFDEAFHNSAS